MKRALPLVVCAAIGLLPRADAGGTFDRKTVGFSISFNGETSAYRDMSTFVLPGADVAIEATGGPAGEYTVKMEQGDLLARGARAWKWKAPQAPGVYTLKVSPPDGRHDIELHVFVMVPAREIRKGYLNGYRIGSYPAKPLNGNPIYLPPAGFVEVTKHNVDMRVSPHFKLKQFLCKGDLSDRYPKYIVLKERLLLKLEAVLEQVNALGFRTDTLHVMSGYRTPYYNTAIGDVPYSQHQWGSAADIFVDPDDKGRMADLDRNRVVDVRDARYLYDRIEEMLALREFQRFQGGMGFYPATRAHPPFVHVDVRGTRARWQG